MSIRPTYRKRSVLQVLADGMSANPPKSETHINVTVDPVPARNVTRDDLPDETRAKLSVEGAREARERMSRVYPGWGHAPVTVPPVPTYGKCCEEAQLTANELARRNEELSESEDEIAALTKRVEKAEAERDELQARLDAAEKSRDRWIEKAHDLQCELDYRPTLNRGAVELSIARAFGSPISTKSLDTAVNAIMELVPAEGWPEWMGPITEKPEVKRAFGGDFIVDGGLVPSGPSAQVHRAAAYRRLAIADFIESAQAATDDEDQRVEEQAKALGAAISRHQGEWDNFSESARERYRAAIRAGWTPPESEATA